MAIIWTNIENGETGLSVRTKVNNLGLSVATVSTEFDTAKSDITAIDNRVTTLEGLSHKIGFADYSDSATSTTPISVTGGAGYVDLTNDGLGVYTIKTYLPDGVTDVYDSSINRFDFSELSLGDMLDIRLDIEVTTTSPSQQVDITLELGTSTFPYEIPFITNVYKAAGVHKVNRYNGIYIGNNDTLNGGGRFRIKSDANCTVKVNGWYVKITAQ